jgi:hypothetical protein
METFKIANGQLVTPHDAGLHVQEYHNYCLRLMGQILRETQAECAISLGKTDGFESKLPMYRFDAQYEHTLVKPEGRSVDEIIYGETNFMHGEEGKYLIRIPNYDYYSNLDGTIEYSLPNMANIATNPKFKDYLDTAVYVAPTIYDHFDLGFRKTRPFTFALFSQNSSENRSTFMEEAQDCDIQSVYGAFSRESLARVYTVSKILVNVHQTPHHHTFEELRCLPALSRGVIVVSEDVPLKEHIPYHKHIVWAKREELADKLRDVQANYEDYHKEIFTDDLEDKLKSLHKINYHNLLQLFNKVRAKNDN